MDPGPTEPPTGTLRVQPIPNRDSRTDSDRTLSAPEEPRPALGLSVHFGSQPLSRRASGRLRTLRGPASLIRPLPRPPQCVDRRTLLGGSSRDPGCTSPAASAWWERGGDRRGAAWVHLRSRPTALGPPPPTSSARAPAHPSSPRGLPAAGFRGRHRTQYVPGRSGPGRPGSPLRLDLPRPNPHSGEACLARTFGVPLRALSRPRLRRGTPSTGRVWVVHVRPIRIGSQLALAPRGAAPAREPIHTSPVPRSPLSPNRPSALIATPPPISRSSSGRSAAPSAIHGTPNVWIHRETTPAPGTAGDPAARLCGPWDPGRITYDAPPIAPSGTLDVRIPNVGRPRPPRRGRDPRRMNRRPPPLDLRRLSP
jgi:hypothetical protein